METRRRGSRAQAATEARVVECERVAEDVKQRAVGIDVHDVLAAVDFQRGASHGNRETIRS